MHESLRIGYRICRPFFPFGKNDKEIIALAVKAFLNLCELPVSEETGHLNKGKLAGSPVLPSDEIGSTPKGVRLG